MSIEYKVIGRNIRLARKAKKMTQEAVAEAIDMSPQHFGKVERGDRTINLQRLGQLSVLLDVPLESLVTGCVVADDHEPVLSGYLQHSEAFMEGMENLTKGCSEKALRLMLRICKDIAEEDKTGDSN